MIDDLHYAEEIGRHDNGGLQDSDDVSNISDVWRKDYDAYSIGHITNVVTVDGIVEAHTAANENGSLVDPCDKMEDRVNYPVNERRFSSPSNRLTGHWRPRDV